MPTSTLVIKNCLALQPGFSLLSTAAIRIE